ncbi:hypothetical protein [Oceaniglobus trochenteri]|uniref:hypothetical protein n=1 Tax=Oceaniglobus trochenteri TaxID=2763260 RepID=UPI001CFFD16F|nr:hypothetical protein [Oceaniglobus trochenteri]
MKKLFLAAAVLAAGTTTAMAGGKHHHHKHAYGTYTISNVTIVVSCYRGPWREVIWDRPNAVFYDSLVNAGYAPATAHAVAERICRDDKLVGNMENMIEEIKRVIRQAPRS